MEAKSKLWSTSLVALMVVNFCCALSFYLVMVKITQYAVDTYGLGTSIASLTITAYVISALFTRVFFGGKIDVWGVKRALVVGVAFIAASSALYLVPMGFVPLLLVRALHGFGFAITSGSAAAGAALVIPRDRYGEGIGYYSMMQALATGIGPFVAILITNVVGGYFPMFLCATGIAVIPLVALAFLKMPPAQEANGSPGKAKAGTGAAQAAHTGADADAKAKEPTGIFKYVQASVVPISSVLLLVYLGYAGIISYVTMYADERNLNDAVSLYFVVYAAVILVSRPPVGRRVDRKGENSIIYWCLASLVAGFVVLAFAANGALLLVSAALVGFGIGATQSIVQAVIARDTPKTELGKANSTFFMSMDLGSGIGPVAIGTLIPLMGYSGVYLALAAVGACAIVDYYLVHGRTHRR